MKDKSGKYNIDVMGGHMKGLNIEVVEERYNAKFIGVFCPGAESKDPDADAIQWANVPGGLFYQETPPEPEYSNYFMIYHCPFRGSTYITSGKVPAERTWTGMLCEDGKEVIYSKFRHDYVTRENGEMVDGGPEYLRCSFSENSRLVNINILDGQLIISEKK